MSYRVQQALDSLHETSALTDEVEALVFSYETADTSGLSFLERRAWTSKFDRAYASLQEKWDCAITASRDLVSLLTQTEIDELYRRLESDVVSARLFISLNKPIDIYYHLYNVTNKRG